MLRYQETGECGEQELNHSDGQAEKFYRDLKQRGICVQVGMEATGYARWFERLLAELGFELWIGHPIVRDGCWAGLVQFSDLPRLDLHPTQSCQ